MADKVRGIIVQYKEIPKMKDMHEVTVLISQNPGGRFQVPPGMTGKWLLKTGSEASVVQAVLKNELVLDNAIVENGKLKGRDASLTRFKAKWGTPIVILTEIRDKKTERVIGYGVHARKSDKTVIKLSVDKLLEYVEMCHKKSSGEWAGLQNAIYVPDSYNEKGQLEKRGHIKAYREGQFEVEYFTQKKTEYTREAKVDEKQNEVNLSSKDKLNQLFTKEQIEVLNEAKKAGYNIKLIGNPKLSVEQMRALVEGMAQGLDVKQIASPEFDEWCMRLYVDMMAEKLDISAIINPDYTPKQLAVLGLSLEYGLDVSDYANPKLDVGYMESMRSRKMDATWDNEKFSEICVETGEVFRGGKNVTVTE